jgi:Asp/Glu/hydantoin racemase
MKKVMLLHTVKSVFETFGSELSKMLGPDVIIDNILDTFLADDPARHGGVFSAANKLRLVHDLESAQLAEPDVIVVTCSSLSPYLPSLRPFFSVPIISIDDSMCSQALDKGENITVLATAASALEPALWKLRMMAENRGMSINLKSFCNPEAIAALKAGDRETHDRLLLEMARKVEEDCNAIVLAQASMSDMRQRVEQETGVCTLASPELCQLEVKRFLEKN